MLITKGLQTSLLQSHKKPGPRISILSVKEARLLAEQSVLCRLASTGYGDPRLKSPNPGWVSSLFSHRECVCLPALCPPRACAVGSHPLNAPFRTQNALLIELSCLEKEICLGDDLKPALASALRVSHKPLDQEWSFQVLNSSRLLSSSLHLDYFWGPGIKSQFSSFTFRCTKCAT